jgi:hypothetical protein
LAETNLANLVGQGEGRAFVTAAAFDHLLADEHARVEKGAGRNHHRAARNLADACLNASNMTALDDQTRGFGDDQLRPALMQKVRYRRAIKSAVSLDPRPPHRWSFAAVEHSAVDRGTVRSARHQPIEHIEFADEMTFADAAYRWVARHLANVLGAERQQSDAHAATRRRGRSFAPGMASSDDKDIEHAGSLSG